MKFEDMINDVSERSSNSQQPHWSAAWSVSHTLTLTHTPAALVIEVLVISLLLECYWINHIRLFTGCKHESWLSILLSARNASHLFLICLFFFSQAAVNAAGFVSLWLQAAVRESLFRSNGWSLRGAMRRPHGGEHPDLFWFQSINLWWGWETPPKRAKDPVVYTWAGNSPPTWFPSCPSRCFSAIFHLSPRLGAGRSALA